ncbi:Coenzyme F420 hydrogenase/dehydrogenase, beta subunit C-terminal domain [Rothia nasimurium]|uniref:Coenzyme F420 hydrogenase/dehydrogenase, beta subunit C-terminal domain n=1 Tax=Rothia nasimurium TaxID=85336 RepID=UPI001F3EF675|nr:Coenzyme F420 hydrogenase/dehydrogenase, beta subunit C-terminal domain [Rothia nasimurium]
MGSFHDSIQKVVDAQMCTGCGLCAAMSNTVVMQEHHGFQRPQIVEPVTAESDKELASCFKTACPGLSVSAVRNEGAQRHEILGPVVGIWEAYAADENVRNQASSGGVLTALNLFLIESGRSSQIVSAGADPQNPRKTIPVKIMTREQALASAGSRYAPTSTLSHKDAFLPGAAVTGKPCEISARRAYDKVTGRESPFLMSFFCAGTPSQEATDDLIEKLGISRDEPLARLWYRGNGWPGEFTAKSVKGRVVSTSYSDSWGAALGPTVQWRCRVCPDGVGESADITAGDFWEADEKGYPEFSDKPGRSVLIARTQRGYELVQEAYKAGVIKIAPTDPDVVAAMQPYQTARRKFLLARLVGSRIFLGAAPRTPGFGVVISALRNPRKSYRELRGTISRIRHRQRSGIVS